jgi:ribosome-associated protein
VPAERGDTSPVSPGPKAPGAGGESEALARRIVAIADAKGASDFAVLAVGNLVGYTDYLVICTARNERQAKGIHDEVYGRLKKDDRRLPANVEGAAEARWILVDYLDCVLHILVPEMRDRYRLEQLWGEAPRLELGESEAPAAPSSNPA